MMKVLIVKLSSLGDVVHTLPALNALRQGLICSSDNVEIDWLVEEAASGIITGHPMIDEVIVVKRDAWKNSPGENYRTAKRLAKKGYDIVIDFQGLLKSGIWIWLTKGKRRIGFSNAREMSHVFLNEKLPAYDPGMHAVDRYMSLARYVTGEAEDVPLDFALRFDKLSLAKVRGFLDERGVRDRFVTLLPGARWETKLWTVQGFAAVAKEIKEKLSLDVVLAGSEADCALTEEIREASGEAAINLAGLTTLTELVALLSLTRFVVTVDSGPMHIAAALGTPVVAIFGATAPGRTGPYGKNNIIIESELECSPCFKRECPEEKSRQCMEEISAAQVMRAIQDSTLLKSSAPKSERLNAGLS